MARSAPECPYEEDNVIKFSLEEINKILSEAPINASQRFSLVPGQTVYFSLDEVIPIIPEEDRSLGKAITFLNHNNPPQLELWYFRGDSLGQWMDLSKWVSIPIALSGESSYIVSSKVRSIEVVEKAPAQMDNILYFQYDTLPDHSTYDFELLFTSKVEPKVAASGYITLYTRMLGASGYDRTRVIMSITSKPDNSSVTGVIKDPDEVSYEFDNNAWLSPAAGIPVTTDEELIYSFNLTFSDFGDYVVNFKLVQLTGTVISDVNYQVNISSEGYKVWKL